MEVATCPRSLSQSSAGLGLDLIPVLSELSMPHAKGDRFDACSGLTVTSAIACSVKDRVWCLLWSTVPAQIGVKQVPQK